MDPLEIVAEDLLIRPWRAGDAASVHRACQDPQISRWTNVPSPYPLSVAQEFVTERTARAWADAVGAPLGVFDPATGELLGSNGLISIDPDRATAEIGYWVAPWARGRSVAERASRVVAGWALDTLGVRRLTWHAEIGNHASRLVAQRVGFQMEGLLRAGGVRRDGRVIDTWVGSLLPGELTGGPGMPAGTAGPGSVPARRAAVFGHDQPVLPFTAHGGPGRLRQPAQRDLDAIVAACLDPESTRWTTVPHPYGLDDARWFVHTHAPRRWLAGDGATFAIADADDRFAGSMELRIDPSDAGTGDVGFLVAPHARGRGYAPAALATLAAWGFDALGLTRVEWRAHVGNVASRRTAERAGFTIEGTQRGRCLQRGERVDAWTGAMLAGDARAPMSTEER